MYRIQCKARRSWKWGLKDYTLEQAETRLNELQLAGITARIKHINELLK